ncbi:tetratricopeptide repeat-containing serine protease family protein, partial [Chamaesiphon sp. GL140_3_metabinner_50]|uniref:tetratricopeptide repeat-containing S1 family peptidase n=1 Tax=Chamaesiphon sp. GL140_3_metabinner_50 TaxID=2970812 RepID=UPI0025FF3672
MSSRISLWVGLIGVAATIPLVQTVAVAKSSVEMHRIGKAITVLITSNDGQGSGVILQHQGDIYTVLTAAHVVRKKVNYKITTPDERQYEVISDSIQTSPGDIDLAVVKFKATTKYTTAKLGNCNTIEGGMDLYVTGFPAPDEVITATTLVVREGKVTANSNKTFANGYSLIYSNDTLRGMSGGAVLNNEGELVAIHGKGDRNKDKDGENAEKNGYNVGISINRFQTVASRMGVELNGQVAALSQDRTPKADDYLISGIEKSVTGNPQGALADFNRAIALNPNFDKAYQERGFLKYSKLKDTQGALADYNRAIQLNPNYLEAYYTRGLLKDYKNDPQGALADYNRAIQINPNDFKAYNARARLKTDKLNDTLGSLADYQRVIQLQPTISSGYEGRGLLRDNK